MGNFVKYRNHVLAKNSEAYQLWQTYQRTHNRQDQNKLDQHLKLVEQQARELVERYA